MQDDDYSVMCAIAKILIRNGVISEDDITGEADNLARTGRPMASHNLTMLLIEAQAMSASEFEADYRRRQMVERTAYLNRKPDDGKPNP